MAHIERTYELMPYQGHQASFHGKATVDAAPDGSETLRSYGTPVMRRDADGTCHRLWDGWSATTGRHVIAFCGLHKADYMALPYEG